MWLDAKFLSIRGRLSCYQQSRPFELWIPGEALPTLIAVALTVRYTSQVGIQLNERRWNVTATMNLCSGSCAPDIMWHH